jgi:ABC-type multidrug transport system fused ATPase/permease subunit
MNVVLISNDSIQLTSLISDDEILDVLKRVGLETTISGLPGKLEYQVKEGGKNISAGKFPIIQLFI